MFEIKAVGCDAETPSVYLIGISANGQPVYGCRCIVCSRCQHHTGNSHQGHYWKYCMVTNKLEKFHFCCPNDCELVALAKSDEQDFDKNKSKVQNKAEVKEGKTEQKKIKEDLKKFNKDG